MVLLQDLLARHKSFNLPSARMSVDTGVRPGTVNVPGWDDPDVADAVQPLAEVRFVVLVLLLVLS